MMFAGLMSRWTMPSSPARCKAVATWRISHHQRHLEFPLLREVLAQALALDILQAM